MKVRKLVTVDGENYELSDEFLSSVLETAVDGACSHWADVEAESADDEGEGRRVADFDVSDYEEDEVEDAEADSVHYTSASFLVAEDPAQGGTLDLEGIADAIERIASGEVEVPPAIRELIIDAVREDDFSEIDAEAADCIVQVGLFDELAYSEGGSE